VLCRDIIEYGLSNSDEAAKALQKKGFDKVFVNLILTGITSFLELESHSYFFGRKCF